ncbi:TldD/PmbA family protein [uncultured Traorella sp.]|uniref:TldD/PmbA family protein n=1 Tax=uncultured Traorella sp. TaxID=1929048 RepID=UPI0025E28285|nr:TldD/PmbA family protein [uncultured Traorella sp.]
MQVKMSGYLMEIKPKIKELITLLDNEFEYVSVLCTDVSGTSYRVGQRQTNVGDYGFSERGFVVRVYENGSYCEYSFNECEDVEACAKTIASVLKDELKALENLGISKMESPLIHEEEMTKIMMNEIEVNPEEMSAEDILAHLKKISDAGAKHEGVIEFQAAMQFAHVNKMFLSDKKDLMQSYAYAEGMAAAIGSNGEKTEMAYESFSGLKGAEILDEMDDKVEKIIQDLNDKLNAEAVVPGMYDVITTPEVTGLIAHEAFGHGVEMDMFVKERALAKDYIGKKVASDITSMKDGALSASQVSSYMFDDEGTLGSDTTIIDHGTLVRGISDLLSALRLKTVPTGNGKRESFERKAYARMTNTLFASGTDSLDDMIASIKHGYLLEGMDSGMEDPKHWGIQCVVAMGREIKDGKLTGKVVAPVTLTGYVPDMLKSISMISNDFEMFGSGACGKGHKEWVKVSDGGPYLKCKVRLG